MSKRDHLWKRSDQSTRAPVLLDHLQRAKLHTKGKLEISFSSQLSVHTVDWTYCPSLLPLKGENVPHADLQLQSAGCIH